MGMVFGKIDVETPEFEVLHSCPDYEIRNYSSSVVAQVTYDPSDFRGDRDGGFMVLANYIGALGNPQNVKPEKIAMTAPVITTTTSSSEKIAMTAPVITTTTSSEKIAMTAPVITITTSSSEKIAMTAPVITTTTTSSEKIAMTAPVITGNYSKDCVTMKFVLPSKYRKAEEAPAPTDGRVVVMEEGERKYGVVRFSGVATEKLVNDKAGKLKECLERDGHSVAGELLLARYNPPWTLPPFRTNEIMLPILSPPPPSSAAAVPQKCN